MPAARPARKGRPDTPPAEPERSQTRPWQDIAHTATLPGAGPATAVLPTEADPEVRLVSMQGRDTLSVKGARLSRGQSAILGRDHASDLLLEETSVSRRHARLRLDPSGQLIVTDLGSANGTWRDNRNISTATFASGDEVRFGTQRYRIEIDPAPADADPTGGWLLTGTGEKGEYIRVLLKPAASDGSEVEWTLGRNENAVDIAVKASDVSSRHAVIRYRAGSGLEIADRGSANGTYVRGQRVGTEFVRLGDQERVQLGEVELTVQRVG